MGLVRLITPTATMAEPLRNQLAREGFLVRVDSIQTLARFLDSLTSGLREVSPAIFQWSVRNALAASNLPEFQGVKEYPGFQRAFATLLDELQSAGCTARDL